MLMECRFLNFCPEQMLLSWRGGGVGGTNRESLLQCHVARGRVSSVYEFVKIGRGSQAQLVTILLLSSCIHIVYLRSNYI